MMKIYVYVAFIIFTSFGNLLAKDINIFGMENQKDVYEYVDSLYDAEPNAETLGGYNSIWITAPKPHASFEYYNLDYEIETNLVHGINAQAEMFDLDFCIEQMQSWIPRINKKFSVNLEQFEQAGDGMFTTGAYAHFWIANREDYIDIRCNHYGSDGSVALYLMWRTEDLNLAIEEFYNDF